MIRRFKGKNIGEPKPALPDSPSEAPPRPRGILIGQEEEEPQYGSRRLDMSEVFALALGRMAGDNRRNLIDGIDRYIRGRIQAEDLGLFINHLAGERHPECVLQEVRRDTSRLCYIFTFTDGSHYAMSDEELFWPRRAIAD